MIEYFRPSADDMPSLRAIYLECFDEDESAAGYMFKNMLKPEYAYAARYNGETAAALYLLPCEISLGKDGTAKAHYLMGAGTRRRFRRFGIMSGLIKYSNACAAERGDEYSVLRPADGGLFEYYAGLGYKKYYYSTIFDYLPPKNSTGGTKELHLTKSSFDIWSHLRFNICKAIRGSVCWSKKHLADCAKISELYGGGIIGCDKGYALYTAENGSVLVEELICEPEHIPELLLRVSSCLGADKMTVRAPTGVYGGKTEPTGMILPLTGNNSISEDINDISVSPYLGLSLD